MAHSNRVDGIFEDNNLSVQIGDRVQSIKLGTSTRLQIGQKYLATMLHKNYKVKLEEVYLQECRKVIQNSATFYIKTSNSLNLYRENNQRKR